MAMVSRHDVTMRIVLDEQRPYFPGEPIRGKVVLASPRSIHPQALRLTWAGGVTIQPTPQDQQSHLYFRRHYALCDNHLKGKRVGTGWTYKSSAFVENYETPLLLVLEQAVTYSFAFDIKIPDDIPLPSSTETETSLLGGNIMYTLECCLDMTINDPTPTRTRVVITVLEHMDVRLPGLNLSRHEEAAYSLWLSGTPMSNPCDYRTAMRVTLPCQAATRGGRINVGILVWHGIEYWHSKGVTVRLLRVRQLHYQGCDYAFPDETIISMRADVDLKQEDKYVQTLHCDLPIREDLTPSISDIAKLLEISYKVRVEVQLQDGSYQTLAGEVSTLMSVEIPILIGTVPLIVGNKTIIPRKTTRTSTNDSKKSDASINSAAHKKQSSSNDGGKVEKKNRSFWKTLQLPGITTKSLQKDNTTTTIYSSSPVTYSDDNDSNQSIRHDCTASPTSPSHNDSHSTIPSEVDQLSTRLQKLYEPGDNTLQSVKITTSNIILKPDEKDHDIGATAYFTVHSDPSLINKEYNNNPTIKSNINKKSSTRAPTFRHKSGSGARVRVVNIFVSSDEEDGNEQDISNTYQGDDKDNNTYGTSGGNNSRTDSLSPSLYQDRQHVDSSSDESDYSPLTLVARQTLKHQ
ncbi:hypothetical protein BC941DRAFT_444067 [Chlamydoabsidia padenii]|nr:hypothetical protein BC941DRAFT_444067 [Chlamydoabsidia padenii]